MSLVPLESNKADARACMLPLWLKTTATTAVMCMLPLWLKTTATTAVVCMAMEDASINNLVKRIQISGRRQLLCPCIKVKVVKRSIIIIER